MMARRVFWGQPEPDPDDSKPPLAEYREQVAVFMHGLDKWLHSSSLDSQLDSYLEQHPRPDEPHDPALD